MTIGRGDVDLQYVKQNRCALRYLQLDIFFINVSSLIELPLYIFLFVASWDLVEWDFYVDFQYFTRIPERMNLYCTMGSPEICFSMSTA